MAQSWPRGSFSDNFAHILLIILLFTSNIFGYWVAVGSYLKGFLNTLDAFQRKYQISKAHAEHVERLCENS